MYLKIAGRKYPETKRQTFLINVESILSIVYYEEYAIINTTSVSHYFHEVEHETARKVEEQLTILDLTGD